MKGRPTAYVIAAILGVAGIGGLSSAVAQQGQGQGQTTQGQTAQGQQGQQGQTTQGQGQGSQGQGQLFPSDCSQGQGQNCADCAQGQGQGCNPDTASQETGAAENGVAERVVVRSEAPEAVSTERVHFGG